MSNCRALAEQSQGGRMFHVKHPSENPLRTLGTPLRQMVDGAAATRRRRPAPQTGITAGFPVAASFLLSLSTSFYRIRFLSLPAPFYRSWFLLFPTFYLCRLSRLSSTRTHQRTLQNFVTKLCRGGRAGGREGGGDGGGDGRGGGGEGEARKNLVRSSRTASVLMPY